MAAKDEVSKSRRKRTKAQNRDALLAARLRKDNNRAEAQSPEGIERRALLEQQQAKLRPNPTEIRNLCRQISALHNGDLYGMRWSDREKLRQLYEQSSSPTETWVNEARRFLNA